MLTCLPKAKSNSFNALLFNKHGSLGQNRTADTFLTGNVDLNFSDINSPRTSHKTRRLYSQRPDWSLEYLLGHYKIYKKF